MKPKDRLKATIVLILIGIAVSIPTSYLTGFSIIGNLVILLGIFLVLALLWPALLAIILAATWIKLGKINISKVKSNLKSFLTITVGTAVNIALGYFASYVVFTFLIMNLGFFFGLILSWLASFITFYAMFLFYAWSKKDWIGMERIKANLKKEEHKGLISKMLVWANRKGEKFFFMALSIKLGPFTSLVYMRDPHDYNKMQKKDWRIFLWGYFITNLFVTIVVVSGIIIYKTI